MKRQLRPPWLDERGRDLPSVALVSGFGEIGKRVDRADQPRGSKRHKARIAGANTDAVKCSPLGCSH